MRLTYRRRQVNAIAFLRFDPEKLAWSTASQPGWIAMRIFGLCSLLLVMRGMRSHPLSTILFPLFPVISHSSALRQPPSVPAYGVVVVSGGSCIRITFAGLASAFGTNFCVRPITMSAP